MEENMHYIKVCFEDKNTSTPNNFRYNPYREYEYKTNIDYKQGQILDIESMFGHAKVVIINENVALEDLKYDPELIKELVEYHKDTIIND